MTDHETGTGSDRTTTAVADDLATVTRAGESLHDIDDTPLQDHAERYRSVHADLQRALSDTENN